MLDYLDYLYQTYIADAAPEKKDLFTDAISRYKKIWIEQGNDTSIIAKTNDAETETYRTALILNNGSQIAVWWNVSKIFELMTNPQIIYLSLEDFECLRITEINQPSQEILNLFSKIEKPIHHKRNVFLLMESFFLADYIFLDGHHKYVEAKKFFPDKLIPVTVVDDYDFFSCLLRRNDLIAYTTLFNVKNLMDWMEGYLSDTDFFSIWERNT